MTDRASVPAPDYRAPNRRAVADVEVEARERLLLVADRDEVGRVEDGGVAGRDPVANRRRSQRVLDRKRLELDPQHR
jgi:hypothetical protein